MFIQDQTSQVLNLELCRTIQNLDIAASTTMDARTVQVIAGTAPIVGNHLCLKQGTAIYQNAIIAVSGASSPFTVTLDTPLDFAFTTAAVANETSTNMAVNGSVTPVVFRVSPQGLSEGTRWDITRVIFVIRSSATPAMDDGKFGNLTSLTNGVVLRVSDGYTKNIFNVKNNGEFALQAFDANYSSAAPAGTAAFRCRRTFNGQEKNGVVIRLAASTSDELQVIVQDNLSGLTSFKAIAQGHFVEE